ncbi:hypothetical protein Y886_25165 [Xanthomonas hyacinthi DSM 19077]|nr:hypothetical protein Y886_25165 [Xanthomonas hyacinthi DSM 19077]
MRRGERLLLSNVDLTLHAGYRAGVVGRNGTGKSSLFAAIRGELEADKGDVELPGRLRTASVAQETPSLPDPALDFVLGGDTEVAAALQAEAAPRLDALRAQSQLLRMAGREAEAAQADRAFDALLSQPAVWEPTMLILREKGKRQRERGIDFFVKRQTNQLAEAMRTVGQWTPYEPVP